MENNGNDRTPWGANMEPEEDPDKDFPIRESVEDAFGNKRSFQITYESVGLGYTLIAREEGKEGLGYEFSAFSETSPCNALFRLREKMYRSLATRHITWRDSQYVPMHGTIRGRITWSQAEGLVVVVDGIPLTLADLGEILAMHEGWQFRLDIVDPSDDISK
ncbi:MAG: hypothetical protein L0332_17415 [Chloroflexi bacterium]|nr:hypothetical protein [Chloroflexota bacterium]MCI0580978.1 hypothetical protein [Chloroflexota bacterium]MCI0645350.1 hypothetical protein [Chloroflexota bacterium]MCI0728479.1 hypothetical protein [Chloroflexota bacterium]